MKDLLANEVFVGLLTAIFGGYMTYLGVARKSKTDVTGIYTQEIRAIINELKEKNVEKDKEILKLETLVEKLKNKLDQSQDLLEKIEQKQKDMEEILTEKEKQINELGKALKSKKINRGKKK